MANTSKLSSQQPAAAAAMLLRPRQQRGPSDGGPAAVGGPMRSVGGWGKPDFNNYKQATPTILIIRVSFCTYFLLYLNLVTYFY